MKFTVLERLTMLNLLPPAEGNLLHVKIVHDVRLNIAFSEEDLAFLQFDQGDGQLRWQNGVGPKEVDLGPQVTGIIMEELGKLDEQEKLREAHLSLVEKFKYEGQEVADVPAN